MNRFTPPTYETAFPEHDGTKVSCDRCEREVWPFVLQDMRALAAVIEDWLCDGCLSDMHRHLVPIDARIPLTRKEWAHNLMQAHGAPQDALDRALQLRGTGHDQDKLKR